MSDDFSAFVFKIQANMNKAHRDRIAFMRICSGKFERGMEAYHVQEGKNIKLATYASRCIENEILMYLRKNAGQRTEVSFDEPLNTDWDGKELLLSDVLGTEGDGLASSTIAACDYTVKIPMSHGVDSLNVAAASAVAFYQLALLNG